MKEALTAEDILYIKPRTAPQGEGEHRIALESVGMHGTVYHPYYAAFASAISEAAELQGQDFTVRFKQQPDRSWKLTFLEVEPRQYATLAQQELQAVLARCGLTLYQGDEPYADGSPQIPFAPAQQEP